MPFKIEEGKVSVWSSYGLKVKINPNGYDMNDASLGLTIEFPIKDMDLAALLNELEKVESTLMNHCKFGVGAELGVEMVAGRDGIALPAIATALPAAPAQPYQPSASVPVPAAPAAPAQSSSPGRGQYAPPKADLSNEATFQADFGTGLKTWIDCRRLKQAGVYKPGAADFRNAQDRKEGVWLYNKDGSVKPEIAAAMEAGQRTAQAPF